MSARLALVSYLVADYDEAIAFFVDRLGFSLTEDTSLEDGKRWVVVMLPGGGSALLLARAATDEQRLSIGAQAGGRVFLFLHTDDFVRDHTAFSEQGVQFLEEPRDERYGRVAVFADLYGQKWDLIGPATGG